MAWAYRVKVRNTMGHSIDALDDAERALQLGLPEVDFIEYSTVARRGEGKTLRRTLELSANEVVCFGHPVRAVDKAKTKRTRSPYFVFALSTAFRIISEEFHAGCIVNAEQCTLSL